MLPKTIKIGGLIYEIEKVEDLDRFELSEGLIGMIYYQETKIRIDEKLPKQLLDSTLIHELTHGILNEAGYSEQDEQMVDRVGRVLYQVLKDNDFSFLHD